MQSQWRSEWIWAEFKNTFYLCTFCPAVAFGWVPRRFHANARCFHRLYRTPRKSRVTSEREVGKAQPPAGLRQRAWAALPNLAEGQVSGQGWRFSGCAGLGHCRGHGPLTFQCKPGAWQHRKIRSEEQPVPPDHRGFSGFLYIFSTCRNNGGRGEGALRRMFSRLVGEFSEFVALCFLMAVIWHRLNF